MFSINVTGKVSRVEKAMSGQSTKVQLTNRIQSDGETTYESFNLYFPNSAAIAERLTAGNVISADVELRVSEAGNCIVAFPKFNSLRIFNPEALAP